MHTGTNMQEHLPQHPCEVCMTARKIFHRWGVSMHDCWMEFPSTHSRRTDQQTWTQRRMSRIGIQDT